MTEETLFAEAIALPPEERARFLEEACGDNAELRAEVEFLLQSHEEAGAFLLNTAEEDLEGPLPDDDTDSAKGEESLVEETTGANPDAPVPFLFGSRIARGGMGAILEADDCKFGRKIAVKVMLSESGQSKESKQRFVREAAVLGKLEHPNIVPVHDLGRDSGGDLYYSMKLVKGRTLEEVIRSLRAGDSDVLAYYTLDRLLTIFRKVCDALAFAHSEQIIHRDLKPENIMVGEFGEVLVMDWGLAKILGAGTELVDPASLNPDAALSQPSPVGATLDGSVMGTPQYMSPEQAAGNIAEMDSGSDIYSLGGILYAILTLRAPVEGEDIFDILEKVKTGKLVPPTRYETGSTPGKTAGKKLVVEVDASGSLPHIPDGKIPNALSAVAMKALSLRKEDRYESVSALSEDIEKFQGGFATSAEEAGLAKQLVLLIRRNKGIFTTAAAAWLLITMLAVWFIFNLHEKERRAISEAERATDAETVALQEKEHAREFAAEANLALADAFLREGNGPGMVEALELVPEDLRDSTWTYLLEQSDTSLNTFPPPGLENIHDSAPHPLLPSVFAIAGQNRKIVLLNIKTGQRILEFTAALPGEKRNSAVRLAVSPDGERIALGQVHDEGIVIHSARNGEKLAEWPAPKTNRLEFSPDGTLLLQGTHGRTRILNTYEMTFKVWDSDSGKLRWEDQRQKKNRYGAFTPDGRNVVFAEESPILQLLNTSDGSPSLPVEKNIPAEYIRSRGVRSLSVGSTGMIAIGDTENFITILDPHGSRVVFRTRKRGSLSGIRNLVWSRDGKTFVSAIHTGEGRQDIQQWDPVSGQIIRSFLGGRLDVKTIKVHPLSGELLVSGSSARAWDLTGLTPEGIFSSEVMGTFRFWGSDRTVIAPTDKSARNLSVREIRDGETSPILRAIGDKLELVDVSADGQWAALTTAQWRNDQRIFLLRQSGGKVEHLNTIPIPGKTQINHLRLSPVGDRIIGFYQTDLVQFKTATGESMEELERGEYVNFNDIGWLSDDRIVGVVTSGAARLEVGTGEWCILWDSATGKIITKSNHDTQIDCLAVDPNGRRFAEAGTDKKVRIRNGATLGISKEFRAHDGPITAIAWHPSKPIIATASTDLSIRLWNVDTGAMLEEFRDPVTSIYSLSFSPSGKLLGSSARRAGPQIWAPKSLN